VIETFELQDAEGTPHRYEVILHATRDGMKVVRSLAQVLAGPLGALVEGAAKSAGGPAGLLSAIGKGDASSLNINLADLGPVIADAIGRLPADIELQVLGQTSRDGKPLVLQGRLSVSYDEGYRANYAELLQALLKVIRVNRFLPGLS
jgi:hypothetical protein